MKLRGKMSTNTQKANQFAIKFNKNARSANRKLKSDQHEQNTTHVGKEPTSDDVLTRMAIEEIVKDTAKGAIRAEQVGPSGWLPCPLMKTNKRFLRNTIKSVITHNRSKTQKPKKSEEELDEIIRRGQKRKPKFGERKHCFRRPIVDKANGCGVSDKSK